jgi:hypothetical protein
MHSSNLTSALQVIEVGTNSDLRNPEFGGKLGDPGELAILDNGEDPISADARQCSRGSHDSIVEYLWKSVKSFGLFASS